VRDDDDAWHDALFLVWIACAVLGLGAFFAFVISLVKG